MLYTIIYTQEPEGGYTAEFIDLPGCISYGETMEESQIMISEAIQAYQESLEKHKEKSFYRPFFISTMRIHETVQA